MSDAGEFQLVGYAMLVLFEILIISCDPKNDVNNMTKTVSAKKVSTSSASSSGKICYGFKKQHPEGPAIVVGADVAKSLLGGQWIGHGTALGCA